MLAALLERSPLALAIACSVVSLLAPLARAAALSMAFLRGMYAFIHDELVPVALDWSARAPLLHTVMNRMLLDTQE